MRPGRQGCGTERTPSQNRPQHGEPGEARRHGLLVEPLSMTSQKFPQRATGQT